MEFSLHISVFELHLSLDPVYSKGVAQTCQDMIPQNAGRLGVWMDGEDWNICNLYILKNSNKKKTRNKTIPNQNEKNKTKHTKTLGFFLASAQPCPS